MIHVTNGLLGLGLLLGSALAWPALPETIPVHFGISGEPDRWVDTSLASWFGLPLLGVAMAAGMYLLGRWLPARPEWISLPDRERFLALDPEEREPVYAAIGSVLHWTTLLLLVVFGLAQVLVYREATGLGTGGILVLILVVAVMSGPVLTVMAVVRIRAAMERAWRRHRARAEG